MIEFAKFVRKDLIDEQIGILRDLQAKIKALKDELSAIDYTIAMDNLTIGEYEKLRRHEIICKIQVLNEVIISFGVQTK